MAAQGIASWSTTAGSNGVANSTINMAEGMAPSAVNDGIRALMARLKEYSLDICGALTTAGTSTAYTLTTNEGFASLALLAGQPMVAFVPHATNGATVTLNVDGLGAKPLRASPGVELQSGSLIEGTPYVAFYSSADTAFYVFGNAGLASASVPLGTVLDYGGTSAPNTAFALCAGQALSRTTFAPLFSLFGTTYGVGDGSTTFNIMDLRGRFVAGLDNMGGSAASRITVAGGNFDGTAIGTTGGAQNHTLSTAEIPAHTHANTLTDPGHVHSFPTNSGPGGGANVADGNTNGIFFSNINTNSSTTGITITNASIGGGGAHTVLNPCIVLSKIVRVI